MSLPTTAYIGLGANLGDRAANIGAAVERLRRTPGVEVVRVSSFMENPAVGMDHGAMPFYNAAAELKTTLGPQDLLDQLLDIERELGRERREQWVPRPIDLDLLLYGDQVIRAAHLTVPHAHMHERDFVLKPLAKIAGEVVHPVLGRTIGDLTRELLSSLEGKSEMTAAETTNDEPEAEEPADVAEDGADAQVAADAGLEIEPEGNVAAVVTEAPAAVTEPKPVEGSTGSSLPRIVRRPARKVCVIARTVAECRAVRAQLRRKRVALVPTMGALHEGHLLLMQVAHEQAPSLAVSIFVNPTQFGPREDFNKYPRPIEEDIDKCRRAGADLIFIPTVEEMYSPGMPEIAIDLPQLTSILEGKHRPTHFRGVCQVVAKLFNIMQPNVAVFGRKDFQQLRVITAMVEALNWPIDIVPCPTLRDPDGLALSSRNQYLSPEERQKALAIPRALAAAEAEFAAGFRQSNRLQATMQRILLEQHLNIDYVAAIDPITLKTVDQIMGPTVLAIAARVGNTRLIDNAILEP